jgi:ferredoxin-NADP reductase
MFIHTSIPNIYNSYAFWLALLLSGYLIISLVLSAWQQWQQWLASQRLALNIARIRQRGDYLLVTLVHPAGKALPKAHAGQHILLYQTDTQGRTISRAYSLVQSSRRRHHYQLAIKIEAEGRFTRSLRQHLLDQQQRQQAVICSRPRGHFRLAGCFSWRYGCLRRQPQVFIAAGIGITPFIPMLLANLRLGRPSVLYYQARHRQDLLWHRLFVRLSRQFSQRRTHQQPAFVYHAYLSQADQAWQELIASTAAHAFTSADTSTPHRTWLPAAGRVQAATIANSFTTIGARQATYYLCASDHMLQQLLTRLRSHGLRRLRYELFSASHSQQKVQIECGDQRWEDHGHRSLLEALLVKQIPVPNECHSGSCGLCAVKICQGTVRQTLQPEATVAEGSVLSCCVQASSDLVVALCQVDGKTERSAVTPSPTRVIHDHERRPEGEVTRPSTA